MKYLSGNEAGPEPSFAVHLGLGLTAQKTEADTGALTRVEETAEPKQR